MSESFVEYQLESGIATIRLNDGKRNALSPAMFKAINAALDRAENDQAVVILTGSEEVFSAGFDLKVMKTGGLAPLQMLHAGYSLTARVLNFPYPVIAACNGHVLAMGVFMMLGADYILGRRGEFRVSANEVALGMTMPRVAAGMLQHRLTPAAYQRAVTVAEYFPVEEACEAGFFDRLVDGDELLPQARALAEKYQQELDFPAHRRSKRRIRRSLSRKIRCSIPLDLGDAILFALRRR